MKILPFVLLPFALSAQITQHGLVLLQNSGKKPLSEVELTAPGANPAVSLANGAFSLTFGAKTKGDYAAIYAKKPGYEVVNQEELRKTGLHPTDTVRVIMCLAGELDRRRLAYYQINEKNITQSYNDKIARLRAENRASDEALSKLGEDYKIALKQLEDYNERFIVMNLDEVSGLRKQAFSLFERGQIDSAIAVLQDELITEDLNRARLEKQQGQALKDLGEQKIKNGEEGEKQAIQAWMDKAEFYVVKLDFTQAEFYYKKAVEADTSNFDNVFKYAFFLQGQRQFSKVEQQYQRALVLARDSAWQALVLNNLGVFYSDNQRMAEAENACLKALGIRRRLAQKNPDTYLPEVAATLNNLGTIYRDNHHMAEAEKAYAEALSIRRLLVLKNPETFEAELANSLDNLGAFYYANQRMADAEKAITESLAIRRKLVLKKGLACQPDLAKTLISAGNVYGASQRARDAENAYQEALTIYRGLAQKNAVFQREVALCLNNLGVLYRNNYDMAAAGSAFNEALTIRRLLAGKDPDAYQPDLAATLSNLGNFYRANQKMREAEQAYTEALAIYRQLALKNPEAFRPDVALCLNNLGIFYAGIQKTAEAEQAYSEALAVYRRLSIESPAAFQPNIAAILNNLGILYNDNGKMNEAGKAYQEALDIRRRLAQDNPATYQPDLATTLNNMGSYYSDIPKVREAEKAYSEALDIRRRLAQDNPAAFEPDVAESLNNLGVLYSDTKRLDQAEKAYSEALSIFRRLSQQNPDVYCSDYASTLNNLGVLCETQKNYARALDYYAESLAVYKTGLLQGKQNLFAGCMQTLRNVDEVKDSTIEREDFIHATAALRLLAETCDTLSGVSDRLRNLAAPEYRSLSWSALLIHDYDLSERAARRSFVFDTEQIDAYAYLGHALLLQGQENPAREAYGHLKGKTDKYTGDPYKISLEDDFDALNAQGITPAGGWNAIRAWVRRNL